MRFPLISSLPLVGLFALSSEPRLPAQEPSPGEVVVEAEDWTWRAPDDGKFARAIDARWASGRRCLVRFFGTGRAGWTLELPEPGRWRVWLRYAATTEVALRAGLDAARDAELAVHPLAATGATSGKRAWGWALLFDAELAAGRHEVVLAAAPLRPDCLLATRDDGQPDYLAPSDAPRHDAETTERLARPIQPLRPAWMDAAGGYELPAWYEAARVQMHTRLARAWVGEPLFESAAEALAGLGARAYVRHVKIFADGALWPSALGEVHPAATERDLVAQMVARAREAGIRLIAYYRHTEDDDAAEAHPDWRCRDDLGRPVLRNGHVRLCLASPYRDVVRARLLELAERGVDGIYLDESHMPREGCFCGWCAARFRERAGLPLPERIDLEDPLYRRLLEHVDLVVEEAVRDWRAALHARDPELVLLVSTNLSPDLHELHLSTRLMAAADAVKTEFGKGAGPASQRFGAAQRALWLPARDVRIALGWALSRDGAGGRPPHVWVHGLRSELEARSATAALLAYGCVANLDHPEETIPDRATFGAAIELGDRLSPHLARTRPVRTLALHFPERARDALAADETAQWERVLAPLFGAFAAHVRAHAPCALVTDAQLAGGELDGVRALFLPAPDALEPSQRAALEAFERAGGRAVRNDPAWRWHDPEAHAAARAAYLEAMAPAIARLPVRVAAPGRVHATLFEDGADGRLLLGLTNDFGWLWTARRVDAAGAPLHLPQGIDVVPPRVEGLRVELRIDPAPESVLDAVSGERLPVAVRDGRLVVDVPVFQTAVLLRIEEGR